MNRNAGGIWRRRCPISVLRTSICGFPLVSPQRNSWKLNLCGGKGGVALFLSRSTLLNCSDNSTWPFSSHSCQPKFISATIRGLFVLDLYCLWKAFGDSWCSKFCRTPFSETSTARTIMGAYSNQLRGRVLQPADSALDHPVCKVHIGLYLFLPNTR